MKNKFILIVLNAMVAFGLKPRTIFSRLGWYVRFEFKLLKKEINRDFSKYKRINDFYSLLPKEVKNLQNTTAQILNREVLIENLLNSDLDKSDYLRVYTLHYLGFDDSSDISEQLVQKIFESKLSSHPFVESLQIFNCLLDRRLHAIVKEETIVQKYNSLKKQIEYHVDGNHVLENLISLVLVEIKFNKRFAPTLKPLIKELNRQTKDEIHWEKNLKYCKDLCLKLEIICFLLKEFNFEERELKPLEHILKRWRESLFLYSKNIIVHDNIDGDKLKQTILNYQEKVLPKNINHKRQIFVCIPNKGVRGHAFDAKITYPLGAQFNSFGTLTYSVGVKRNYQRLRYNNCQPYFNKTDRSHFFFLSFRSVLMMPYSIFRTKSIRVFELLSTKKGLRIIAYKVTQLPNKTVISSNQRIKVNFFVDDQNLKEQNIQTTISQNESSISKALRVTGIDKLKPTNRLILEGKEITIYL